MYLSVESSGMTGSGKTQFVLNVLEKRLVTNFPDKILYLFKIHQPWMTSWNLDVSKPKIEFIHGLDLDRVVKSGGNCIVIIDDLVLEKHHKTAELFIYSSHHMNITVGFKKIYQKN